MVKAGNFDQAIRYYKRMERAGFPANAQTYKCKLEDTDLDGLNKVC